MEAIQIAGMPVINKKRIENIITEGTVLDSYFTVLYLCMVSTSLPIGCAPMSYVFVLAA